MAQTKTLMCRHNVFCRLEKCEADAHGLLRPATRDDGLVMAFNIAKVSEQKIGGDSHGGWVRYARKRR